MATVIGNLYDWFRDGWDGRLDDVALDVAGGARWTYGDLDRWTARFATILCEHAEIGDRVVVQIEKSPHAVALYLACLRAGLVYVPLNTAYTASEVAFFLGDAAPAVFVGDPDRSRPGIRTWSAEALIATARTADSDFVAVERGASDWVAMLYTSGTTGRSKGAMLSGENLASNAEALRAVWAWQDDDVLCHALPIFHVHGLFVALHCALRSASPIHFLPRFEPETIRALLPRSTVLMGVPTHYSRLLAAGLTGDECASMRLFTSGSAPMTEALHAEFTAVTGHRIVERYGMTESMIITSNPYGGECVPGTVGFPVDGVEVRIADDAGQEVPRGDAGIVETRGPNTMLGYWGLPDKTAETIRPDGWLITGDVGSMDADGRVTLAGRKGDMIISGGLNVYPKEIELVLDTIEGVIESAVVGVPHPDFGEAVVAVLATTVPVSLATALAACRDQLASFKHPKLVVCVDELPRNTMGKVQKADLRTRHAGVFME